MAQESSENKDALKDSAEVFVTNNTYDCRYLQSPKKTAVAPQQFSAGRGDRYRPGCHHDGRWKGLEVWAVQAAEQSHPELLWQVRLSLASGGEAGTGLLDTAATSPLEGAEREQRLGISSKKVPAVTEVPRQGTGNGCIGTI